MKYSKQNLPGLLIAAALLIAEAFFFTKLVQLQLLPVQYTVLIAVILIALAAAALLLVWNVQKKTRFTIGAVLAVLLTVVVAAGSYYIQKGQDTIVDIFGSGSGEQVHISVYVLDSDPAQSINDAASYPFGVLADLDRTYTDAALQELSAQLGTTLSIQAYDDLAELMDALTAGEVRAIALNSAFLSMIDEMEGYESASELLREIHIQQITVDPSVSDPSTGDSSTDDPSTGDSSSGDSSTGDSSSGDSSSGESSTTKPSNGNTVGTVSPALDLPKNDDVFTLYISGIDTYGSVSTRSRSDVNIMAVVNTKTHQVLLISTPRDFFVPHSASKGYCDKLTNAGIYGVKASMSALEYLYGIDLEYYFRVNFSGFEKIIDALGGITVQSQYNFSYDGHSFTKGSNELNGSQALAFARCRSAFSDGDRQRGKNQMAVIQGVINKALSPALLTNYTAIMDSVKGNFETSVPYDLISEVVRDQLSSGGSWNIVTYSVNGSNGSAKPYSQSGKAYVMIPNMDTVEKAQSLILQVYNNQVPTV